MGPAPVKENHFQGELDMPMKKFKPEQIVTLASAWLTHLSDKWVLETTCPVIRRNIKGRPFWSRFLSVRSNPSRKDTLYG